VSSTTPTETYSSYTNASLLAAARSGGASHRRHDLLEVLLLLLVPAFQLAELVFLGAAPSLIMSALAAILLALVEVHQPLVPEIADNPGGISRSSTISRSSRPSSKR